MKSKIMYFTLLACAFTTACLSQGTAAGGKKIGETIEAQSKVVDWEYFDSTSKVSISQITIEAIQEGVWKAYKGLYKFGEIVNGMNLTQPIIIEIKNKRYRRSLDSKFGEFSIEGDKFISKKKGVDFGIINKIADSELTITWKDGANYTRYYYRLN